MKFNKTATAVRAVFMSEADDGLGMGGAGAAQDVESRIEQALFGSDEAEAEDDAALDDGSETLPEDDDAEAEDDAEIEDDGEQELDDDDATIASILGLDDDKLAYDEEGNVVFNAIIDGEQQQVTMNDLVKSYQLEGHVNNKSIALENDRREFVETRDKAYTELANRLEGANALLDMATQTLTQEFQGIDWDSLRMTDPAEWTALRQQFSERLSQIESAKAQIGQSTNALTEEQKAEQMQKHQEFLQGEINKMIADNPEWADQTVMAKEVGEIGQFLQSEFGFTPEEVANNMDARLMKLIRMAHGAYKGGEQIKGKKIDKKVPKFRKPGQNNGNRASLEKARKVKAQKQAIRKSGGSVESVAASIVDRM